MIFTTLFQEIENLRQVCLSHLKNNVYKRQFILNDLPHAPLSNFKPYFKKIKHIVSKNALALLKLDLCECMIIFSCSQISGPFLFAVINFTCF